MSHESGQCCVCGCTPERACVDPDTGQTCEWFDSWQTLCDMCATRVLAEPRRITSVAEASKIINGLGVLVRHMFAHQLHQDHAISQLLAVFQREELTATGEVQVPVPSGIWTP